VYKEEHFVTWARKWLAGENRTRESAYFIQTIAADADTFDADTADAAIAADAAFAAAAFATGYAAAFDVIDAAAASVADAAIFATYTSSGFYGVPTGSSPLNLPKLAKEAMKIK
jgi:hypothetical protein